MSSHEKSSVVRLYSIIIARVTMARTIVLAHELLFWRLARRGSRRP
jgi:hypothetical protein